MHKQVEENEEIEKAEIVLVDSSTALSVTDKGSSNKSVKKQDIWTLPYRTLHLTKWNIYSSYIHMKHSSNYAVLWVTKLALLNFTCLEFFQVCSWS